MRPILGGLVVVLLPAIGALLAGCRYEVFFDPPDPCGPCDPSDPEDPPPSLAVSLEYLDFVAAGETPPEGQLLEVWNAGGGELTWTAAASEGWLSLNPDLGASTGDRQKMMVSVDVSDLVTGWHAAEVFVSADDPVEHHVVDITLDLLPAEATPPGLVVVPEQLSFEGEAGGEDPDVQLVDLWNGGGGVLSWSVSSGATWLTAQPVSGQSTGEVDTVTVSAQIAGLEAGVYEADLAVADDDTGECVAVQVTLELAEVAPPAPCGPFVAAAGATLPLLDGVLEPGEWADASVYELELEDGIQTLYLKHLELADGFDGECSIYPDNPSYTLPCGRYLMVGASGPGTGFVELRFDEGDDGMYGSGTGDGLLVGYQEDWKDVTSGYYHLSTLCHEYWGLSEGCPEPYCRPWDDADCWRCSPNEDGGVSGDDCVWSADPAQVAAPLLGDRQSMMDGYYRGWDGFGQSWFAVGPALAEMRATIDQLGFFSADYDQAEIFIPFQGRDLEDDSFCAPEPCDRSDAVFEPGDVLGMRLITSLGTCPADADLWDASTWTSLTLEAI